MFIVGADRSTRMNWKWCVNGKKSWLTLQNSPTCVDVPDEYTMVIHKNEQNPIAPKEFVFDHVFGVQSSQEEVFEDTRVCCISDCRC